MNFILLNLQAPSVEVKEIWVKEIKKVLLLQFEHLKGIFSYKDHSCVSY